MAERRDYYEVLGVSRDADAKAIRNAYRRLALRYHPDRSKEPDAEERFKEIAEAYAVLGSPKKRAEYDARGFAGLSGMRPEDLFSGVEFDDLFGHLGFDFGRPGSGGLFDRLFGAGRHGPHRGADVEVHMEIPLETVVKGGEERISVDHPRRCEHCSGSGARPGTQPRPCGACRGTGRTSQVREESNVRFHTVMTCSSCLGRGRFVDEPCDRCEGRGEVTESETLTVKIPVGVKEGMLLRVHAKGRPAPEAGGEPGDLYIAVHTRPDPRFERRGSHLWRSEEIEVPDAVLGTTLRVPTLDGHARLRVPAGTQAGSVLRIPGKGLPAFEGGQKGDLYLAVQVRVPEDLSREERGLWERLRALARDRKRSDAS